MILNGDRPIELGELTKFVKGELVNASPEAKLSSICDSSKDKADVFVAVKGEKFDGHKYVGEGNRAACIVEDSASLNGKPGIVVKDSRTAKAFAASLLTGYPDKDLDIVGVTGTNGKSSTCWLASHLLNLCGSPSISIGTIGVSGPGIELETSLTTPDAFELYPLFKQAVSKGIKSIVMESSAHALTQKRIASIKHKAAVFTNLSHEHLDYYADEAEYLEAKIQLFSLLSESGTAIVNTDDEAGRILWDRIPLSVQNKVSLGRNVEADFQIQEIVSKPSFTHVKFRAGGQLYDFEIPMIAVHNVYNAVTTLAVAQGLGVELQQGVELFPEVPQIPGRLELVCESPNVFVDYAHTPDALHHALTACKEICKGSLWVVFGCGGDRDTIKRPLMGKAACEIADRVIITSDNPRTEDPHSIIAEISAAAFGDYHVEENRELAIQMAVTEASPEDIILIAGKGHEDYQILGDIKIDFSDCKHARAAFNKRAS